MYSTYLNESNAMYFASVVLTGVLARYSAYREKKKLYPSLMLTSDGEAATVVRKLEENLLNGYKTSFLYELIDSTGVLQSIVSVITRKKYFYKSKRPTY